MAPLVVEAVSTAFWFLALDLTRTRLVLNLDGELVFELEALLLRLPNPPMDNGFVDWKLRSVDGGLILL